MKKLDEKFRIIYKNFYGEGVDEVFIKMLINSVREYNEDILADTSDGVRSFKPDFERIKQRQEAYL